MATKLSSLYWQLIGDKTEEKAIVRFMRQAGADRSWKILDVGCGYGRNLKAMKAAGLTLSGVEINRDILQSVKAEGFECYHPDDEQFKESQWDLILMSHIVEHFDYRALIALIDEYLDRLKSSGYLIIASPLPSPLFWDNFDHVKPYTPAAIEEVFGLRGRQVQLQSRNEIELIGLWIRRRPFVVRFKAPLFQRSMSLKKMLWGIVNISLMILCGISFRRIGCADGWVGLYRKVQCHVELKKEDCR